ncbi:MAG TPA: hypothetical protein PK659_07230, partial [Methanothrix sp.]
VNQFYAQFWFLSYSDRSPHTCKKTKYLFVHKYNNLLEVCDKMKNVFPYWIGVLAVACAAMFVSGLL